MRPSCKLFAGIYCPRCYIQWTETTTHMTRKESLQVCNLIASLFHREQPREIYAAAVAPSTPGRPRRPLPAILVVRLRRLRPSPPSAPSRLHPVVHTRSSRRMRPAAVDVHATVAVVCGSPSTSTPRRLASPLRVAVDWFSLASKGIAAGLPGAGEDSQQGDQEGRSTRSTRSGQGPAPACPTRSPLCWKAMYM